MIAPVGKGSLPEAAVLPRSPSTVGRARTREANLVVASACAVGVDSGSNSAGGEGRSAPTLGGGLPSISKPLELTQARSGAESAFGERASYSLQE